MKKLYDKIIWELFSAYLMIKWVLVPLGKTKGSNEMSEEKRAGPREFWVSKDEMFPQIVEAKNPGKYAHQYYHVIEKSAYDKAVGQWDYFVEEKTKWQTKAEALERELADRLKRIEEIHVERDEAQSKSIDLQSQLDEANKERELVVNNFHGQVGLNRKASKRIAELEAALKNIKDQLVYGETGILTNIQIYVEKALKGAE